MFVRCVCDCFHQLLHTRNGYLIIHIHDLMSRLLLHYRVSLILLTYTFDVYCVAHIGIDQNRHHMVHRHNHLRHMCLEPVEQPLLFGMRHYYNRNIGCNQVRDCYYNSLIGLVYRGVGSLVFIPAFNWSTNI